MMTFGIDRYVLILKYALSVFDMSNSVTWSNVPSYISQDKQLENVTLLKLIMLGSSKDDVQQVSCILTTCCSLNATCVPFGNDERRIYIACYSVFAFILDDI